MLVLIAVVAAVAVLLLVAFVLRRRRDTAAEMASLEIELDPVLGGFVEAVQTCAYEEEDRYVAALARLREDPDSTARQIEATYRSIDSEQIRARQSVLLAAVALADRSVLPLLSEVAKQPVTGSVRHDGGRAVEESILRMIAVDGIEAVARAGDTDAADALLALTAAEDRAVQAAAVVALKYSDVHRAHYERASSMLPADRRYLLDVVRASVNEVPQIADPRRHLLSEPSTVDTRPDPETGERRNDGVPSDRARVPQALERR